MLMRCRFELFVADLDVAIDFYTRVLGFGLRQRDESYAFVVRDEVRIGFGLIADLPPTDDGPGFSQERVLAGRGAGVELVLEVGDLNGVYRVVQASGHRVAEPLRRQPWGLTDFRIADPDGYYLRITNVVG